MSVQPVNVLEKIKTHKYAGKIWSMMGLLRLGDEDEEYPFGDNFQNFIEEEYNVSFSGVVLEEESTPVYDTDIEDVIKEEDGFVGKGVFGVKEDNIEDVVVVANDFFSSMIQTTLSVDFDEDINTKSHEMICWKIVSGIHVNQLIQFVLPRYFHYISWYQEPKFLIKMPPRRNKNIIDIYDRIMARMEERRMNDMLNPKRRGDRNGDEDEEYPFVDNFQNFIEEENNVSFSGVVLEKESTTFYDTDIEDVIKEEDGFIGKGVFGEEEDNIEDVVVVANDFCSSMIQTTLSVDFEEDINTKSHEMIWFGKKYYYHG
ncbi:hypothetical protein Tco_0737782 [Tanacetum coccineum]